MARPLPNLRLLLTLCLLLSPLAARAQQLLDAEEVVHWAYATFMGTGVYQLDDSREVYVLNFPLEWTWREATLETDGQHQLQALEVGIDPAHASFLHRFLEDQDPAQSYGKQFRDEVAESRIPMTRILRDYPRPEIRVEPTEYGLRIIALRNLDNHGMHVRVTNQLFPQAITIPLSNEMTITQWHVPIDDVSCYWYAIFTSFGAPVDKRTMREQRLQLYELPDYIPKIGKANDYGYDPAQQRSQTYTGMGNDINVHDQWAVESMGPIQDRTREHLGRSDVAIRAYRQMLMAAIDSAETGGELPLRPQNGDDRRIHGPVAIDAIAAVGDWQQSWRQRDAQRRRRCSWCAA
jgi:hypothetical protein